MPKLTFVCEHQHPIHKDSNLSKMTYESNREYLDDIVEDFEDFLRGCGFSFDGKLEIVDTDDINIDFNHDSVNTSFSPLSSIDDTITITSFDGPINLNLDGS